MWPGTKARDHTTDIFDELMIYPARCLDHSSRVIGYSFHDGIMNADMELAQEVVDFRHRVLWNLTVQCAQGSIDILEAPIQLVLDIREAKKGINRENDGGKELANRFAITSNSFWPSPFARALVPNRACRPGSAVHHGRVVVKKWRSFSLAFSGVIRASRSVVPGCLTQNHP